MSVVGSTWGQLGAITTLTKSVVRGSIPLASTTASPYNFVGKGGCPSAIAGKLPKPPTLSALVQALGGFI